MSDTQTPTEPRQRRVGKGIHVHSSYCAAFDGRPCVCDLLDERDVAVAALTAARKAIENVPHAKRCSSVGRLRSQVPDTCDCWKAEFAEVPS